MKFGRKLYEGISDIRLNERMRCIENRCLIVQIDSRAVPIKEKILDLEEKLHQFFGHKRL